ncbi:MAG: M20/M25/M40 family metallo-hydrolase [Thermodesulfobacteria bacterium]|nr:M20/M25/M40 family metallo-hydrolase [Thermodesulfobacteriota bacterium]
MTHARVNTKRLQKLFMDLVRIDSPSRHEGQVAAFIRDWFQANLPSAKILEDGSAVDTGSDTGNLIIKIPGQKEAEPLFFNAHMDTVEPGRGIKPIFENGVFKSDGTTVLGGDDKAAIAIILEAVMCLKEAAIAHGPFEILLTTCEEIGLLGAKALDESLLDSKAGYALDTEDPDSVINRAPAAIRFHAKIHGVAAHAGLSPEKGMSAIKVAAKAISQAPQGRIDPETTCNIGLIKGGTATNIVPDLVTVDGEVRSHHQDRLKKLQDDILSCFYKAADDFRREPGDKFPYVAVTVEDDYPVMNVPEDHPIIRAVLHAGRRLDRNLRLEMTGGGSDANIFNSKGLATAILGIGMQKVHTTEEFIRLEDMEKSCLLAVEILNTWPSET